MAENIIPSELFASFGPTGNIRLWKSAEFPGSTRFIAMPAPIAFSDARPWTVDTLGRYLLSLSAEQQARPVWGAYFTEFLKEPRRERDARTRHLSISWERVDGNFVRSFKDASNPVAMVIWTAQDERQRAPEARPLETAPRDGTIVRLLVEFTEHALEDSTDPMWTIGANSFDHTGEDVWQFAGWSWVQDCFTEGEGKPVGWLPFFDGEPKEGAEA